MAKKSKSAMPLTDVIRAWRDDQDWTDEITIDEEEMTSVMFFTYNIEGQVYRAAVDANEKLQVLRVNIYGSIGIPANRYAEACQLVNIMNLRSDFGRICAIKDGQFEFRAVIDVEGGQAVPLMISNMIRAGISRFTNWNDAMAQVTFAGKTTDQILKELNETEENQSESSDDDGVPDKL
jgi:hypothetical protein